MRDDIAYDTTVYAVAARRLAGQPYPVTIDQAVALARATAENQGAEVRPDAPSGAWDKAVWESHQFLQRLLAPVA